jgi:hypothetical protein
MRADAAMGGIAFPPELRVRMDIADHRLIATGYAELEHSPV